VVNVSFLIHLLFMRDGCFSFDCLATHFSEVSWVVLSPTVFAVAWIRHAQGHIEEGLAFHLLFREIGFWGFVQTQAAGNTALTATSWIGIVGLHTVLHWTFAGVLYHWARSYLQLSEAEK